MISIKKFSVLTLGCKLNQYESMGMIEALEKEGLARVPPENGPDLYIINTCTVTRKTDRRSRNTARKVLKWNPDASIIITGCSVQRSPTEFENLPNVKAVLGNREKNNIVEFIKKLNSFNEKKSFVSPISEATFECLPIKKFGSYTRAFVKIQEGCNRNCSYCIIPSVRGPSRSRNYNDVLTEVKELTKRNFNEIVLTGTDLGTYGIDLKPQTSLDSLLNDLIAIEKLHRVRLSSIEPMEFTTALIQTITHSSKICPHFHIPLQSGSDTILKKMNRNYTTYEYKKIIDAIKKKTPDACIGLDVIVGFPGETNELFFETLSFIDKLDIDYLHVFSFSVRENTIAGRMKDQIKPEIIKKRSRILRNLSKSKNERFKSRMIGKIRPAIVLNSFDPITQLQIALTDNYIKIHIQNKTESSLTGEIVPIQIVQKLDRIVLGKVL